MKPKIGTFLFSGLNMISNNPIALLEKKNGTIMQRWFVSLILAGDIGEMRATDPGKNFTVRNTHPGKWSGRYRRRAASNCERVVGLRAAKPVPQIPRSGIGAG